MVLISAQSGAVCGSREFDTTFPGSLAGVMTPQEFQASIARINEVVTKTMGPVRCMGFLSLLGPIVGVPLLITSTSGRSSNCDDYGNCSSDSFPVLAIVGIILLAGIPLVSVCILAVAAHNAAKAVQDAVTRESEFYMHPVRPCKCSWRFLSIKGYRRTQWFIDIDICLAAPADLGYQQASMQPGLPGAMMFVHPQAIPHQQQFGYQAVAPSAPAAPHAPPAGDPYSYRPIQEDDPQEEGAPSMLTCPSCGFSVPGNFRFCGRCGAAVIKA